METIGYVYFDDGSRIEAVHLHHGVASAESTRRDVERSTAQRFEFERRNATSWGRKPTRYDVRQF